MLHSRSLSRPIPKPFSTNLFKISIQTLTNKQTARSSKVQLNVVEHCNVERLLKPRARIP